MTEQIAIFFQIIFIDLVLAGDNAIIIGMVASQFPADQRKKIIFFGNWCRYNSSNYFYIDYGLLAANKRNKINWWNIITLCLL